MEKFVKFSDWESKKYNSVKEDAKEVAKSPVNAELIANLADVSKQRKQAIRDKNDFQAQILEIESKLIKLEIEKNHLTQQKSDLIAAQQIASTSRKEGKTNVKEN